MAEFIFAYAGQRGQGSYCCEIAHAGIARSLLITMNALERDGRFAVEKGLPDVAKACEAAIVPLQEALEKIATFIGNHFEEESST